MKHQFKASQTDKSLCEVCERPYLDHTNAAKCDNCGKIGPCEVNSKFYLLCVTPEDSNCYNRALDHLIITTPHPVVNAPEEVIQKSAQKIIEESERVDNSIRYNGDIYNAKTVAIIDLKKAIDSDDTIPAENKAIVFQDKLAERYYKLSTRIFELDSEKFELATEQLAIGNTLRGLGNEYRKEIRERIRAADKHYQPEKPKIIKETKKREKKDPFLLMVKAFANLHGISETEAEIRLKNGGKL